MNDRIMTERLIKAADFNIIRRNQDKLVKSGAIQKEEEVKFSPNATEVSKIEIKNTGLVLNLKTPWDNELMKKLKNYPKNIKLSFLKSVLGNEWIAMIGAIGTKDRTVKVLEEKKLLGSYKTVEAFTADHLNKFKTIRNISEFDLYQFIKKL